MKLLRLGIGLAFAPGLRAGKRVGRNVHIGDAENNFAVERAYIHHPTDIEITEAVHATLDLPAHGNFHRESAFGSIRVGNQFEVFTGPKANQYINGSGVIVNSNISPGPDFRQMTPVQH